MTLDKTLLAALLVLGACSPKDEPAKSEPAAAPAPPGAHVARFKIGALDAAALMDGTIDVPNDGKTFGIGRPPSDVAAVLKSEGLAEDRLQLSIQPLMVRHGDQVLLFDTGAARVDFAQGGRLIESLREAGVAPTQVTDIFISHGHPDHVGGLTDAKGGLVFPHAVIHISEPEWAAMRANPGQAALVAAVAPRVATFRPGAPILPGLVTGLEIKGHTPGHSAYEISSGGERLIYIGDVAHHSVISVGKPDWTIDYDGDADVAETSRRNFLQRAADQNLRLYAVHFPYPGLGRVKAQGEGFVWLPEAAS